MAFIPIPNAVEVVIYFTLGGQEVALTLGVKRTAPATEENLEDIIGAIDSWRIAELVPITTAALSASRIKATALDSDSAPSVELPAGAPLAGTLAGDSVPNNAALAVSFYTDQRGRSYRGRNYVPGLSAGNLASTSTFATAVLAGLLAAYVELPTALGSVGAEHAVLSRQHNGAPRTTGVATPVTAYGGNVQIDSQRRRLAGRGT